MTEKNKKPLKQRIKKFFVRLASINDSPQKIAIGFGIGIFFGILPLSGPVAAFIVAMICRVNKVAAFAGGLLTNTWLSWVTFIFAVKIGAGVTGVKWEELQDTYVDLFKHFEWSKVFDKSVLEILKPLFIGYAVVGLIVGLLAYIIALIYLTHRKKRRQNRLAKSLKE